MLGKIVPAVALACALTALGVHFGGFFSAEPGSWFSLTMGSLNLKSKV